MKNLENYGVQTLNAKKISIIGGGQTTPPPGWNPSQEAVDLGTVTNSCIVCDNASAYPDEGGWLSLGLMFAHALGLHN